MTVISIIIIKYIFAYIFNIMYCNYTDLKCSVLESSLNSYTHKDFMASGKNSKYLQILKNNVFQKRH